MQITESKALTVANRIVDFGTDASSKKDWNQTRVLLDRLKVEIEEAFKKDHARSGKPLDADAVKAIEREAEDFLEIVQPIASSDPHHVSYARRRIDLDENHSEVVRGADGTEFTLHIDELMDNNVQTNTKRFAIHVLGGAQVRNGFKEIFGDANISRGDALEQIRRSARESAPDVASGEKAAAFHERVFNHTYDTLTGRPVYNKEAMKWAMGMNALNHSTIGMVLGFAQIPELVNIVARTGMKASIQQFEFGDIKKVFTMGLKDRLAARKHGGRGGLGMAEDADDLSACLEAWTGVGGDYARGDHIMHRLDEMQFDGDYVGSNRAFSLLETGRQFASMNPLGIMPMDMFMRRWAVRASFQHFVNQAYEIGPDGVAKLSNTWWKQSEKRFAQIGLSLEDVGEISRVLKNPDLLEFHGGVFGPYKVKSLNLSKVASADQHLMNKFALSLRRHTDSMIQRQTYGEMPEWTNTEIGKFLSQFRVFSIVAKSKQLAAGAARADVTEATNVVGSGALAALGYYMITHYRALGEADPETYLAEHFTDERMMKSAIMRSGYSTIIPMMTDLTSGLFTDDAVFDASMRTTGLGIAPWAGSTTGRLVDEAIPSTLSVLTEIIRNRGFDQTNRRDVQNALSTIWMTKVPGLDQALRHHFINKFPEKL